MTESEKIAELVAYGVLTLTGLWLGYSFIPRLLARFRFKELIRKREETQEAVEAMRIIIDTGYKMDGTKVKGERPKKFCDKGKQAPPDNNIPNEGKHE